MDRGYKIFIILMVTFLSQITLALDIKIDESALKELYQDATSKKYAYFISDSGGGKIRLKGQSSLRSCLKSKAFDFKQCLAAQYRIKSTSKYNQYDLHPITPTKNIFKGAGELVIISILEALNSPYKRDYSIEKLNINGKCMGVYLMQKRIEKQVDGFRIKVSPYNKVGLNRYKKYKPKKAKKYDEIISLKQEDLKLSDLETTSIIDSMIIELFFHHTDIDFTEDNERNFFFLYDKHKKLGFYIDDLDGFFNSWKSKEEVQAKVKSNFFYDFILNDPVGKKLVQQRYKKFYDYINSTQFKIMYKKLITTVSEQSRQCLIASTQFVMGPNDIFLEKIFDKKRHDILKGILY